MKILQLLSKIHLPVRSSTAASTIQQPMPRLARLLLDHAQIRVVLMKPGILNVLGHLAPWMVRVDAQRRQQISVVPKTRPSTEGSVVYRLRESLRSYHPRMVRV